MSIAMDNPAFPETYGQLNEVGGHIAAEGGMTMREYAAIKLRVPNSGTDWLDEMIVESLRDWFASTASDADIDQYIPETVGQCQAFQENRGFWPSRQWARYQHADAMIAERSKPHDRL